MAKKVISVDNLDVIRNFVLSKVMTESEYIRRTITDENMEYIQGKLSEATNSLKNDYESKYNSLQDEIERLKLEAGNPDAIRELELQLDALNNNYVDMQNALKSIEDSLADINDSVMSPGQLNELINAALIEKTTITDDMIETPNLYTKNLVALIAKFGKVRALNIIGDEIKGKTISAFENIPGTDEPTWRIDKNGNGYLANKNISWDKDGNVEFGPDVKIGWGSVTDTPDDFGSGISIFTSTVFTRNNEKPSKPTGGSYSKPTPDESVWTDGIPDGDMILWASTRVFASDGGSKQQIHWSEPAQMTDTATFDVEFSSVITNPGNPTDNPDNWSNDGTTDTIWMATRTISNGETSDWIITKIKGEDGKDGKDGVDGVDGKDGTSISIAGTFATEDELKAAYPDGPDPVTNAYVVGTDLYVWANGQWKNVGQFTGKDGVNGKDGADGKDGVNGKDGAQVYLHIKYADSIAYDIDGKTVVSVDWTDDNGEVRGPYQGMYSDYVEADSTDCTKYKWFQIDAEKAVQTEFGKYKITSNTIAGKTIHSTTEIPLEDGTTFETFNDDGLSLGTTTSDGTTEGPAWQLRNLGDGYLAKGNIRWDAAGNVEFGPKVKLGWSNIDGPTEQYKLTANIPYLRRKDSGTVDYNNEKNDPLLSIISDKGTGDKMFTITVKEYNPTTGQYDKSITDTIRLYRLLTYTDGTTHKPGYANAPNGIYSGPDTKATAWLNLKNIRFYLIENDTTKCFVDIPVIGYFEEWVGDGGLTSGDVDNRISTALSKYKVTSENIEGTTIKGSVIKTKYLSDMEDSGAFYLDGEDGVFGLGNDAIRYDGDDVYISGDNVHIDGDVLINGTAIMNGIESDNSAKQQLDELIAGKIDAAEIKTSVLETKSSVKDSVRIRDNYIHCFNDSGDKNLIISSNKMDTSKLDRILGSGYTSQQGTGMVLSNVTLSKPSGSSVYSNQSVWYSHTSPCSLGYILAGSTVTVYVALQALNVAASNYNSMSSSQYVPAANWTISEGTGQVPYVVGGGGTKYAGGMLLVYKKNDSGDWEEYDGGWLKGTWQDCAQPWTSSGTATTKYYKCVIDSSSIDIDEDGEYGIRLGMEVSSIQASAANTVKSIAGLLKASVNQKQPSTYTEIGKDGIVVYDGTNVLRLDSNGVVMMAKTSIGSSKFYGFKVTKDGFYLCKNGDSWREWDPSFD